MSSLKDIISGQSFSPPVVLLYGPPGVGKTTLPAMHPRRFLSRQRMGPTLLALTAFRWRKAMTPSRRSLARSLKRTTTLRRWSLTAWIGWKALCGPRSARFRV